LRDGYEDGGEDRYGKVMAEPKELIEFKVTTMTSLPRVL